MKNLFFVFLFFLLLCGCGRVSMHWSEKVRLADGMVLVVERTAKGKKYYQASAGAGWESEGMTLFVRLPDKWSGSIPPKWESKYPPILLDYSMSGRYWVIVSSFWYCEEWRELGMPKLPYVEYKSVSGGPWNVVPLEDRFIGRKANLLAGPSSRGEPRVVSVEDKDERNREVSYELGGIVSAWKSNCAPRFN